MTGNKAGDIVCGVIGNKLNTKEVNSMINVKLLNSEMAKVGLNGVELAKRIGITPKTFYAKRKNGSFGCDEISIIIRECEIENPIPIFFPDHVSKQATK